ncbi:hypothetical protein BOX15_Mlig033933g6 [Macrostomum lignano]|uniref:UPAR/Ly6 domain-containing protein n=1 Tax=Macrostomum lignano TaxID=282301 RepID=A0A267FLW7_9PLAT|nr:hypothetical protein BOX15_Mlig033933g2 [Macrostomum lignano]PAA74788.1 hypothetical protein BOX15_Mlig033933g6 [Macrostomum lignano]
MKLLSTFFSLALLCLSIIEATLALDCHHYNNKLFGLRVDTGPAICIPGHSCVLLIYKTGQEGGICGTCIYVKAKLKVLGLANDTIIKCEECSEDLCNIKKFTSRTGASSVLTLAAGLAVLITVPWLT